MLDVQPVAPVFPREHFEHLETGGDDFDADAVPGYRCDPVFAHGGCPRKEKRASYLKGQQPAFHAAATRPLG
jgi:hypothetical protein